MKPRLSPSDLVRQVIGSVRGVTLSNPVKINAKLILDPLAPIPASMGKRDRERLAELREAYAYAMQERMVGQKCAGPDAVAAAFQPLIGHLAVESFAAGALNARLQLNAPPTIITRGDTDGVEVPMRAIFRTVLVQEAVSFVVAHNHPSGQVDESAADRAITTQMVNIGRSLGCQLVDHVIVTNTGVFRSLRANCPELWR